MPFLVHGQLKSVVYQATDGFGQKTQETDSVCQWKKLVVAANHIYILVHSAKTKWQRQYIRVL